MALTTLPDSALSTVASADATYANAAIADGSIVEFARTPMEGEDLNRSVAVTRRFQAFLPERAHLSAGERLYLYAEYLGRQVRVG